MSRGLTFLLWVLVPVALFFVSWTFPTWESFWAPLLKAHPLLAGTVFTWAALLLLWWLPKWQATGLSLNDKERADLQNEIRKTLAQILGGAAVLLGLYFSWENLRQTEENAQETRRLSQEGQITDRFTKAINQLGESGAEKLAIRLGGIYALERIARDSKIDHWPIMEVLTAYVREQVPWREKPTPKGQKKKRANKPPSAGEAQPPRLATDIQAILTVLGRRRHDYDKVGQRLNLIETDLQGAFLPAAHLEAANFSGSYLGETYLGYAYLSDAWFGGAHLDRANLEYAHLEGAFLGGAHLDRALLHDTHLESAFLQNAYLGCAFLRDAHLEGAFLQNASLAGAYLPNAHLEKANLQGAHLDGAFLAGANLQGALDLTIEQLSRVATLYGVQLDPPFMEQIQKKYSHLLQEPKLDEEKPRPDTEGFQSETERGKRTDEQGTN
jgi:uncharacterized protein YjbI with pentapeptide repeats